MIDIVIAGLATILTASIPLILAGTGELVCEKSGVINLGVEGMMAMGAVCGFMVSITTGSLALGVGASILGGVMVALIFAFTTQILLVNQMITGLALTLFCLGLSALFGQKFVGLSGGDFPTLFPQIVQDIPIIGKLLFGYNFIVYFAVLLPFFIHYFLMTTRMWSVLSAVGDHAEAAHALGIAVVRVRVMAIAFGGGMAGLAGGYLSLAYTPLWAENMTAGRGWVAIALVVFAAWRPVLLLFGALLFGGVSILQLNAQAFGINIGAQYLSMLPYVATVIALALISKKGIMRLAPKNLGKTFFVH